MRTRRAHKTLSAIRTTVFKKKNIYIYINRANIEQSTPSTNRAPKGRCVIRTTYGSRYKKELEELKERQSFDRCVYLFLIDEDSLGK